MSPSVIKQISFHKFSFHGFLNQGNQGQPPKNLKTLKFGNLLCLSRILKIIQILKMWIIFASTYSEVPNF